MKLGRVYRAHPPLFGIDRWIVVKLEADQLDLMEVNPDQRLETMFNRIMKWSFQEDLDAGRYTECE